MYVEGKTVCFLHACCFYFYLFVVDFLAIYTKRQVILLHVMSSVLYKSMLCDKLKFVDTELLRPGYIQKLSTCFSCVTVTIESALPNVVL